jgi:hypothetical protein
MYTGECKLSGALTLTKNSAVNNATRKKWAIRWWKIKQFFSYGWRELPLVCAIKCTPLLKTLIPGFNIWYSTVELKVNDGVTGEVWDYGVVGYHLITTAGKDAVAGAFNSVAPSVALYKYHGYGTNTTSASAGDTTLGTELTTQYATANTRPTGSQANSTNTYTTAATVTPGSGGVIAITEWGLFTQASNAGGTLLDHQVFSAINLNSANGDSLTSTYTLTFP